MEMPKQDKAPDPLAVVKQLESSMMDLGEAMQGAGAPPELLKPLDNAIKSFGEFVSVMTGSVAPESSQAKSVQSADTMGAKSAVPADMPRGGKARMVPA